ncbi:phosphoserine aminotransferase [Nitratiruptor sp. YY08-26]|uniref:pyridoxal-phosphate-dependent aminotransferase family protein n=1 Tax=unclassified Nitratiruptor TaxID=2624044 RepID=UPI0019164B0A|nr:MULTISPECIES: alanine--glyoxylate aminotransferase family protein [unclassified Nitratiruptor]BCD62954.1 phosphoserine aminotransferase [Nitratiruptor sp. YY08-13]BCD66889.1 phosphoserine aminotransferase [Nitratiruptor sp. YY08-26]
MLLFTPGPTPVPERIRQVMALPTIHHRTPEFTKIFKETRELLLDLLKMQDAVMLASTGTGAMEACVTNLCHKKALVVNAGKFGERFVKIAEAFGKEVVELTYPWDTAAKIDDVVQALKEHPDIDAFCIQICESSGGLRHPVEEIAAAIKAHNPDVSIIADGITAVGVEPIDTTNIDALITGSQKALMLPPGLAMIGLSLHALGKIGKGAGFYFNLASELKKQREGTTAYTAATTLVIGLREILHILLKEIGLDEVYDHTDRRATATRVALEALGLAIYPQKPANAMTAIYDEQAEDIRKLLKNRYGVNVAGGQEELKGKLFRINHMGLIEPNEAAWVVNAVEKAMADLGRIEYRGVANKIFNEIYFSEE